MTAAEILAVLDAQYASAWPQFEHLATHEYYAMRLVVLCEQGTDDWGLVFETIRGNSLDETMPELCMIGVDAMIYGPSVPDHAIHVSLRRSVGLSVPTDIDRDGDTWVEGVRVSGPAGDLVFESSMIDAYDLRAGQVCNQDQDWSADMLLVRAYLARYPGSLFPSLDEAARPLSGHAADVLFTTDAFEHVLELSPAMGEPIDRFVMRPSESPTYRSVADAIANRDASRFVPGDSNLDWRLWVRSSA